MKYFLVFIFLLYCQPNAPDLTNTFASKEEVIRRAFEFISNGDEAGLNKILLTREEHNNNFWNYVGERFTSDPGMTSDLAFEHMSIETHYAKQQLFQTLKNKSFSIQNIHCNHVEKYGPFKLHLGCRVSAINPSGLKLETNGIRTVIELNGKYKLYHLRRE